MCLPVGSPLRHVPLGSGERVSDYVLPPSPTDECFRGLSRRPSPCRGLDVLEFENSGSFLTEDQGQFVPTLSWGGGSPEIRTLPTLKASLPRRLPLIFRWTDRRPMVLISRS